MFVRYLRGGWMMFRSFGNNQWSRMVANEGGAVTLISQWNSDENSIN
jgi:hypothetical protein